MAIFGSIPPRPPLRGGARSAKGVRLLADTQPSADIGHVRALPKVNVSLPKQAYDLLCTASLLHPRTLSSPIRGKRILSQDLAQDLGRASVPRVEFTLNLVAALPSAVAKTLRQAEAADDKPPAVFQRTLLVNVFHEPQLVRHAGLIMERRQQGLTFKAIGEEIGLTRYHMENCAEILRLMEAEGLTEPYRRLTEKPDHVPRWCSKHWLKAGDRKSGGKRRRAG